MKVVVYAPDLMDRSRFDVLKNSDMELAFVSDPTSLVNADASIVIADLSRPNVLVSLQTSSCERRIAFVSHVDEEKKSEAIAQGIEVYNRSVFFSRVVNSLADA